VPNRPYSDLKASYLKQTRHLIFIFFQRSFMHAHSQKLTIEDTLDNFKV